MKNVVTKKMNKDGNVSYTLTCVDGTKMPCTIFTEKATGKNWVKLPKDNPSGRTFIAESLFAEVDKVEFDTKTEFRTGVSSGGWRSRVTDEEAKELAKAEAIIESIKKAASERKVEKVDPNSEEGIQSQMKKLQAKLEAMRAKKA